MKGIDYGYGKPGGHAIAKAGYEFVCRYLSHSPGKNLTKTELNDLWDNNLDVVVVWETTEQRALSGYNAGVSDANDAHGELVGLIGSDESNAAIYFAADYDFNLQQQNTVNEYLKGAASVIGLDRVGVYGSYATVKHAFDKGVITYGWQTYAWSHGKWDSRAQLRQTNIYGPKINGVSCDTDETNVDDYGQL